MNTNLDIAEPLRSARNQDNKSRIGKFTLSMTKPNPT